MGIPKLPKKEVPEVGYRAIYDWVINHLGDELDGEKTTSEVVISLLDRLPSIREARDMWKARTRMMQEEQAEVMKHYFDCFAALPPGKGEEALKRADELLRKYDPDYDPDRIEHTPLEDHTVEIRRKEALKKLGELPAFPDSLLAASGFPDSDEEDES